MLRDRRREARRKKSRSLAEHDLGLTSYGLLRRDAELYRALAFDTVVLDEAQHIKNPDTQNAQAAFNLRSRQRFVLTGTPDGKLGARSLVADEFRRARLSRDAERFPRALREAARERARAGPATPARAPPPAVPPPPPQSRRRAASCRQRSSRSCRATSGPRSAPPTTRFCAKSRAASARSPNDGATRMKMLTGLLRLRQACCDLRLLGLPPNEQAILGQARSARRAARGNHRWRASRAHLQPVCEDARSRSGTGWRRAAPRIATSPA